MRRTTIVITIGVLLLLSLVASPAAAATPTAAHHHHKHHHKAKHHKAKKTHKAAGFNDEACGKALDHYHNALIDGTIDADVTPGEGIEAAEQHAVVTACEFPIFDALLKGDGYDYTRGVGAIAYTDLADTHSVYAAFCSGEPKKAPCHDEVWWKVSDYR